MNVEQLIAFLPILCIAGFALLVMLTIVVKRHFALVCSMASIGIVTTLTTAIMSWGNDPVQVTLLLKIDHYALFYLVLLAISALAVIGYCYDYFKQREGENEELILLLLIALLGSSVLVTSTHFASFFIGLETLSVSLFAMIAYSFANPKSLEAAIKYLILSGISSAFLLMGMAFVYAQCGVLDFVGIGTFIANQDTLNFMVLSGIVFMVAGLSFKLSLVPFHMWTSDVYEGAPAPVTAFIATVSKGAVFALLLRYFIGTGSYDYSALLNIFSVIAVATILTGNLLALLQQNIKRILAYSSIAHIGYLLVAFIAGGNIVPALVAESVGFYLIAYFITTLGAFGVVSILSTPQAEAVNFTDYQGLFWRKPWLAASFTIMLLSLAGIPLTAGFIGKFYIITAGIDGRLWMLLLTLIIGSGLGLFYYLRIIVTMSMRMESIVNDDSKSACKWFSYATQTVLTLFVVWFGIYPGYLMSLIQSL